MWLSLVNGKHNTKNHNNSIRNYETIKFSYIYILSQLRYVILDIKI